MWSIHIPDYSATKGNDILKNAETWTNLINTKLRKSNQTEVLGMVGHAYISVISIIVLLPAACCLPESLVLGLLSLHIN